jgi:hypothetical protein
MGRHLLFLWGIRVVSVDLGRGVDGGASGRDEGGAHRMESGLTNGMAAMLIIAILALMMGATPSAAASTVTMMTATPTATTHTLMMTASLNAATLTVTMMTTTPTAATHTLMFFQEYRSLPEAG